MTEDNACRWEHFSHDADIGIRGFGERIESAFAQAALAMTAVICDIGRVNPVTPREIRCAAPDHELLFVEWLNALIYEMAVERMLFSRFDVEINGTVLHASAWGEPIDRLRHQPAVEVKGATYTELKVTQSTDDVWLAQCVIDV
jgi:SHS2 domain-containing protein